MNSLKVVCVLLLAGFPAAETLRCYQCLNLEMSSRLFSRKKNPGCGAHHFDRDSVAKVSCGSGTQCVYYTATVEIARMIGNESIKMKIDSRSCSPDTGSNGCIDGNNKYIRNMMNGTITLLASLKYRFTIKGVNGCSCSEDLCNGGCAGTNILVGHKCVSIFFFIGLAAAVVIVLLGICCCYCCPCCCRLRQQNSVAAPDWNPFADPATDDPFYGYDQYPQNLA